MLCIVCEWGGTVDIQYLEVGLVVFLQKNTTNLKD